MAVAVEAVAISGRVVTAFPGVLVVAGILQVVESEAQPPVVSRAMPAHSVPMLTQVWQ